MPPETAPSARAGEARLAEAERLLVQGRMQEARALTESLIAARPRVAAAHRILGLVLQHEGDLDGAEAAFRAGLKHDRSDVDLTLALADLHEKAGRPAAAEQVLRAGLEANRRSATIACRLAHLLVGSSRAAEAIRITAKFAAVPRPDHAILVQLAAAHKALGEPGKSQTLYERAASLYPDSPVAHHNLAASLGDAGKFAGAARSAARAFAKGAQAPQTWLVYARALLGSYRLDDADKAFREAIRRQPAYLEAHRDLAQLIWMRTEDSQSATAVLDADIAANPRAPGLLALRASILHHAGQLTEAYATLQQGLRQCPDEMTLHRASAQIAALLGDAAAALRHAERCVAQSPDDDNARFALLEACLATGDAERASTLAQGLVERVPRNQRALAYQATAWRLLGDPRYAALYDYAAFVRVQQIDVPEGWTGLSEFLSDLADALNDVHRFRTHPLDQSLRHGSQAAHLLASEHPTIRAFFQAVDCPIRQYLTDLGSGPDPLRARNCGGYKVKGAWSVKLRAGGFHVDHIHPEGWISSACYIALPNEAPHDAAARKAWIKFGAPGVPTAPPLPAEHFVKPELGSLVLFPSYMWHGTVPFDTASTRLSIAFDLAG